MKHYMLIMKPDGCLPTIQFYDDFNKANDAYNICCVALGWYSELYEYDETEGYIKIH